MLSSKSTVVYNALATAFGLGMIVDAVLAQRPAAPIWYAVVIVFGASAWTLHRAPARWIARTVIALNSVLALLIVVFLANLALHRDEIGLTGSAIAPRILLAAFGLFIATSNVRALLRRWQASPPPTTTHG